MSSIETQVIKFLASKENYYKYKEYAQTGVLLNETRQIVKDFEEYYTLNPSDADVNFTKFRLWYRMQKHPAWKTEKKELYDRILSEAETTDVDNVLKDRLLQLSFANDIASVCRKIKDGEGSSSINDVLKCVDDYNKAVNKTSADIFNIPVNADIVKDSIPTGGGLDWRLHELNQSVGPLYKSDHIMIGKRPESGGTSLMVSEMVYMLPQLPEGKKAIIFHNEEGAYKVSARILQCALDRTTADIIADVPKTNADFEAYCNGRSIELYHNPDMTVYDVERKLSSGDYALIGFNILEKVHGFSKQNDQEHARFAKVSAWARNLAVKYGVVFSIAQADYSAEGQKWMNQSQLMNSKTGVQGETDVLIMVGRDGDHANDDTRYISVVRNKKPVVPNGVMDPRYKYAQFETWFNHETGIYRSK